MCKRRIVDLSTNSDTAIQRYRDTAVTDSKGFLLEWGGVGQNLFLAESQSGLYPHMRAQFGRDPTAVSKKVSFKFISRFVKNGFTVGQKYFDLGPPAQRSWWSAVAQR